MYDNAFNSIERTLRAEEGIANELDYVEQISWVLFLHCLHDLESERCDRAKLDSKDYAPPGKSPTLFLWARSCHSPRRNAQNSGADGCLIS